jgi:hypothetical protein
LLAHDDAEGRAILRTSMVVQLATLSATGRPFVTPIWFVVDAAGSFYMTTGVQTRAARNVSVHPEVTLLFGGERAGTSERLRIRGTATCHRGFPPWRILLTIAMKYYLAPAAISQELRNARRWALRLRYYREVKGGAGYLRVVPTASQLLPAP